ncbi:MAG: hypothetical protein E6G42_07775 [Actinobacteria bacterium]|nr:MAG: hypothetical protein E6G42_07775 [Actinomycetota bacterium]
MVQLRLHDPSLTTELVTFLRRCQCSVRDLGPATVGVGLGHPIDPDAAVQRLQSGLCYRCGNLIADSLFRLGSSRCHDCRESPGLDTRPDIDALREDWTRMEVESYLRVWRSLHPDAYVELVA